MLAALVLTACAEQSPPLASAAAPPPVAAPAGPPRGIDVATDASDMLNELKASKVNFVARYYREPASRWPALSASEAQRLSSLGMTIVAVWESHSHNPDHFNYAWGYYDAVSAYRQASAVGQPTGSAIYFAVDFDAAPAMIGFVDQYFRGVTAGFAAAGGGRPRYKVGVYGSGAVCQALRYSFTCR